MIETNKVKPHLYARKNKMFDDVWVFVSVDL